eukprot:TRINITY_DN140_c0_g1_i11.p1 TRINITY_DN140_c0_g1~~TRINITY_DN140_c0_g1_i11.p1  ORF type:complete len:464 (+),score=103.11 TRINITY_DN140_c0_g1_i11:49-1440(+)
MSSVAQKKLPLNDRWTPNEDVASAWRFGLRARWVLAHPLQRVVFRSVTAGEVGYLGFLISMFGVSVYKGDTKYSGKLAQISLMLAFATAARNSPLTFLFGIPFERRIFYHMKSAVLSNFFAILHGYIALTSGTADKPENYTRKWSGIGGGVCSAFLFLFSLPPIRRKVFDLFYSAHWVFFTAYIVFLMFHSAKLVMVGIGLWVADVAIRSTYTSMFQPAKGAIRHIEGTDIVEVSMEGVKYLPGQYAFIAIPEIGSFQWHPISFSTAPCEGTVARFCIRCGGDWGERLLALAKDSKPGQQHKVLVDGAYGNTSIDIDSDKYKHFLFVAGGIGITPMRSIATAIAEQGRRGRSVQLLETHWSVRDGVATAVPMSAEHGLTMYRTGGGELEPIVGGFAHKVKNGRIDVNEVVREFKEKVEKTEGKVKVAVLFCGPGAMFTPLRLACKEHSSSFVSFDLHTETFEF